MRNDNGHHVLPDEFFVVQLDGHVKSAHGRFVEALREALSLRDEFPQHEVKVRASQATLLRGDIKQPTTLH